MPPPPRQPRPARQPRPRPAPRRRRRLGARGLELQLELAFLVGGGGHLRGFPLLVLEVFLRGGEPLGGGGSLGVLESGGGSDGDGGFHAGDRGGGVHPRGDGLLRSLLLGLHQRRLLGGEPAKLLSLLRGNRAGAFLALLREESLALGGLVRRGARVVDIIDQRRVLRGERFVFSLGGGGLGLGLSPGCRLGIDGGRGGLRRGGGRGLGLGVVLGSLLGPPAAVVQDEHLGAELRA